MWTGCRSASFVLWLLDVSELNCLYWESTCMLYMCIIIRMWLDLHCWWAPFVLWSPAMLFRWLSDLHLKVTTPWLSLWSFSDHFMIQIEINIAVDDSQIFLLIFSMRGKKLEFIIEDKAFCFRQLRPKLAEEVRPLLFFGQFHVNSPNFSRQTVRFVQKSSSDCGNFLYGFFTGAKLIFYPGGRRLISLLFALKWSLNSH